MSLLNPQNTTSGSKEGSHALSLTLACAIGLLVGFAFLGAVSYDWRYLAFGAALIVPIAIFFLAALFDRSDAERLRHNDMLCAYVVMAFVGFIAARIAQLADIV